MSENVELDKRFMHCKFKEWASENYGGTEYEDVMNQHVQSGDYPNEFLEEFETMKCGLMASIHGNKQLPLRIMHSHAGYYIGTADVDGAPYTRESEEYFRKKEDAEEAFASGRWTQRSNL